MFRYIHVCTKVHMLSTKQRGRERIGGVACGHKKAFLSSHFFSHIKKKYLPRSNVCRGQASCQQHNAIWHKLFLKVQCMHTMDKGADQTFPYLRGFVREMLSAWLWTAATGPFFFANAFFRDFLKLPFLALLSVPSPWIVPFEVSNVTCLMRSVDLVVWPEVKGDPLLWLACVWTRCRDRKWEIIQIPCKHYVSGNSRHTSRKPSRNTIKLANVFSLWRSSMTTENLTPLASTRRLTVVISYNTVGMITMKNLRGFIQSSIGHRIYRVHS